MILWNTLQLASLVSLVSGAKVLFEYQGTELPTIGPDDDFDYLAHPNMPTDGKELTIEHGHLVINNHPFKCTRVDFHDALKFQMYTNRRFECNSGKVTVQMTGSAVMHGVEDNPFGEEPMLSQVDARLATSVFSAEDVSGQAFGFAITNARISAIIQAPFVVPPSSEKVTSTMSYNVPLVDTRAGEEHTLALIFDATAHSVSWSVDGIIHYTWTVDSQIPQENRILRWGDLDHFTYPNRIGVVVGNYVALAYYPLVNDANVFDIKYKGLVNLPFELPLFNPQTGEPAEYIIDSSDQNSCSWRQGAVLRIERISVTHEAKCGKIHPRFDGCCDTTDICVRWTNDKLPTGQYLKDAISGYRPRLSGGSNMRLQILLALTGVASASNVLFEYDGNEYPINFPNGKFSYLRAIYDEDNDVYIPQASNGDLLPTAEGLIIECNPSQSTQSVFLPGAQFIMATRAQLPFQSGRLDIEMTSKVQISGIEDHPFGDTVKDPQTEARLASTSINLHGMCGVVFSFVFTNGKIYAYIFKAPRKDASSSSQYLIPLIDTVAGAEHTVKFVLDADSKSITWIIDGQQTYFWQQGTPIDQKYCVLRDGEDADPNFPTDKIGLFIGIWSFWEELSLLKGGLKEHTVMLDSDAGEQAQNVTGPADNEWSPKVVFIIKNITATQEL